MVEKSRFNITIDRNSSTPIYQQLCDWLIRLIQSDELQVGEYLPTENEIGELSGLSRMTVRKAIDKLNQMGMVDAVRGRGTFIVSKERSAVKNQPSIGFVLRPHRYIEEDPFYSQILMGVTQEVQKRRIHLAFISGEDVENEEKLSEHQSILKHLSGLIIAGQMPGEFLEYIQSRRVPSVFLNYRMADCAYDTVTSDQKEIGRLLAGHLAGLGHKTCLYLSGEADNIAYEQRLAGFREVFESGKDRLIHVLKGGKQSESGREMIRRALEKKLAFTSVAAGNDMIAIGAMNELLDRGFRVPEDISVSGIDNVPLSENCRPALSTVHIEKRGMGVKAVQLLLERLRNPMKTQETVLLGVQLCCRQSTGPLPKSTDVIQPAAVLATDC